MARTNSSSGPTQRMLRVGEQVRAAITQVLQRDEIRDPLIESTVIAISEVRMSNDLKIATAYVTPLGQQDHAALVAALNRNDITPALRQMKFMPEVRFRDDTSFDNYQKIDELLRSPEVARDLNRTTDDHGDDTAADTDDADKGSSN
jgi:ribosome-binding factor A